MSLCATVVESEAANKVMDVIRDQFVAGDVSTAADDGSGIMIVEAEEFA